MNGISTLFKQAKKKKITKWKISKVCDVTWYTVNNWDKEIFKPTKEHLFRFVKLIEMYPRTPSFEYLEKEYKKIKE